MARPVVVFEDDRVSDLYPLTLTRPVWDLVCGVFSLGDKLRRGLEASGGRVELGSHARGYVRTGDGGGVASYAAFWKGQELVPFVNGRWVFDEALFKQMDPNWAGKLVCGETVVAANVGRGMLPELERRADRPLDQGVFAGLPSARVEARVIAYPWDLVTTAGDELERDFSRLGGAALGSKVGAGVHLVGEDIRLGSGVILSPGVVLDASEGPVIIEDGASVMANASLRGPVRVGSGSTIKMGAAIYGPASIGPGCKVGGELGETIIHGHSNKQHEGFVGHSYLGEWVNIGAGTNTSDLKNNYSTVKAPIAGELVDSGQAFVGLFMGDHSKSGIGSVFNAGTSVGICCNIYGSDYPPKHIPSFTWGGSSGFVEHRLEAALETARRAMARRGRALEAGPEAILRKVFQLTAGERSTFLGR
ncbi:MAG: putative sugar nucleotidyl transferase [bacterium]